MMMVEVIWEEPGELAGSVWPTRLKPLMEHRARWAMIHEYVNAAAAAAMASQLRRGYIPTVPRGEWEFAARGTKVYARYLGET